MILWVTRYNSVTSIIIKKIDIFISQANSDEIYFRRKTEMKAPEEQSGLRHVAAKTAHYDKEEEKDPTA